MRSVVCKQKSEPKKERMSHPARYSRTDIRSRQPRLNGDRDDGGADKASRLALELARSGWERAEQVPGVAAGLLKERPDLGIAKRKPPRQTNANVAVRASI